MPVVPISPLVTRVPIMTTAEKTPVPPRPGDPVATYASYYATALAVARAIQATQ